MKNMRAVRDEAMALVRIRQSIAMQARRIVDEMPPDAPGWQYEAAAYFLDQKGRELSDAVELLIAADAAAQEQGRALSDYLRMGT